MIHSHRGARAAEAALFAALDARLADAERHPPLLALAVRVVVPSRSLKAHLGASLVRRRGRAAAGVVIQTLFAVASEIAGRAGLELARSTPLFDLLARRLARDEAVLREELEQLDDGYATVAGTLRDLLDAGFAPEQAPVLLERLARAAAGRERERAAALVRVTAAVARAMQAQGFTTRAALLEAAARALTAHPARTLPSRAVLIHGFADATGAATRLLAALASLPGAEVFLDRPPDPVEIARDDPGMAFSARFTAALERAAGTATHDRADPPAVGLTLVRAPGPHAELRAVAERIQRLLARGVVPERIGVVARELAPYRLALRLHFSRLGIPFSAPGASGPAAASGRRAAALADLLQRGARVPAERWLDARNEGPPGDLRTALATMGVGRLADAASADPAPFLVNGDFPLPVRHGLRAASGEDEGGRGAHATRRRLSGRLLAACLADARRTVNRLGTGAAATAPAAAHTAVLRALVTEDLRWPAEAAERRAVLDELDELERALPPGLLLTRSELVTLLLPSLREIGLEPLGGAGGGVAVLGVIEARARTFEHLFLVGLNRDVFPRVIREDPLLPDALRARLAESLPALPIKKEPGFAEEHFLFAELLSAAPAVTLSWCGSDDDGKPAAPSPLIERLRLAGGVPAVEEAAHPFAPPGDAENERLRTPAEHATRAGLFAARPRFADLLPVALAETDPATAEPLAAARLAVLDEVDPELSTRAGQARLRLASPWFGQIGPARGPADPRSAPLFVTGLESYSRCPWQHFLGSMLRLEVTPDPLADLPAIGALEVGQLVHAVLERIARLPGRELARDLAAALAAEPVAVTWPDPDQLTRLLAEEAPGVLRENGHGLPGLARVLIARARPRLEVARALDWSGPGTAVPVAGVEVDGTIDLPAAPGGGAVPRLGFRADRVDRKGDRLILVDYKTGKPPHDQKRPDKRQEKVVADVSSGQRLQPMVYALAAPGAEGRFHYLSPDGEEQARVVALRADDEGLRAGFAAAATVLLAAREQGSFLPRVIDPAKDRSESRCANCELAMACVRGDSGARRRLRGLIEAWSERRGRGEPLEAWEAKLLDLAVLHD